LTFTRKHRNTKQSLSTYYHKSYQQQYISTGKSKAENIQIKNCHALSTEKHEIEMLQVSTKEHLNTWTQTFS